MLKLGVVDEWIRRGRRVGTIDQSEEPAVKKQGGSVGVEKDGRIPEVVMIDDQIARGLPIEDLHHWARRKIRIEGDHCQSSGVEENNHHKRDGEVRTFSESRKRTDSADQECNSRHGKREAKIGEG